MISCQQYDYIEIACMYRFPVRITLKNEEVIEATAYDTKKNDKNEECLLLKAGDKEQLVTLDEIAQMEAQIENPHFTSVTFA